MAITKKREIKQMNDQALANNLEELRKELFKLNAKRAVGTALENPGKIKQIRKTIARMLTAKNNKEVKQKTN